MKFFYLVSLCFLFLCMGGVFAYTTYNNTVTMDFNLSSDVYTTYNNSVVVTFDLSENVSVSNSCSYSSGNWVINIADNCNISSTVNLGRSNLTLNGSSSSSDRLYVSGGIKNFSYIFFLGKPLWWGTIG